MKKIISRLIVIAFAVLALSLVGCGRHERSDVCQYVKDMDIGKCRVSLLCQIQDDHGVKEKSWKVKQLSTGITFTIVDEASESGPFGVGFTLRDDYDARLVEYYEDELPEHNGIEIADNYSHFTFEYTGLEDLKEKSESLANLYEFLFDKYPKYGGYTTATYNNPFSNRYRGTILEHYGLVLETSLPAYDCQEGASNIFEKAKLDYLDYGYIYRLDFILDEFTEEEISDYINSDEGNIYRVITFQSGTPEDYANAEKTISLDVIADYRVITYGNLYYYLQEQGVEVTGTPQDFTFVNYDGKTWECSYDFFDTSETEDFTNCTYCLVDGEKVYNESYPFGWYCYSMDETFGFTVDCIDNDKVIEKTETGELSLEDCTYYEEELLEY